MSTEPKYTGQIPEDDRLILVDEQDRETGSCEKVEGHLGNGKLHRALSVFLFDPAGKVLIQQRNKSKMLWGGYWANSCCSHPRPGENVHDAADRRVREELGVQCKLLYLYKFVYRARFGEIGTEYENCSVFAGFFDGVVQVDPEEISDWCFVSPEELTSEIETNGDLYSPWFKLEWKRISSEFLDGLLERCPG